MDETEQLLPRRKQFPRVSKRLAPVLTLGLLALLSGLVMVCYPAPTAPSRAAERPQQLDTVGPHPQPWTQLDEARASFPLDCSFHQYTLSADDDGLAYVSGDGRAFRSDHTNLFGRGVTGKIVSVDANAFLIRSSGECCRFMDPGDEILLRPTTFANYRSVGSALFDTSMATLWVDPAQASMFWLDANGLPLRWDYIPKSPAGKRITAGKMMSMVFSNFTIAPQDRTLFDVPAICTTAQRCRFD